MTCNVDGQQGAALVANVNGGSKVTFTWNTWPTDHHGPVTTYMASCGGDCTNFDATNAEFFKIDQAGLIGPGQFWASDKLIADNFSWTVTIPKTLADGEYLVRHEILAMHSTGAPQFYPSCTQVRVNNGGSSTPAPKDLVKATQIYDGSVFPDIWSNPTSYKLAGPAVASFVGGGGSTEQQPAPAPAPASAKTTKGAAPAATTLAKPDATSSASGNSPAPGGKAPTLCRRRVNKKRSEGSLYERHAQSHARRVLRYARRGTGSNSLF